MKTTRDGFTLLEMVVAIAIVALLSVVVSQIFLITLRTNTKTEVLKDMKQNGEIALESIVRAIQNAASITCTSPQSIIVEHTDTTSTTFACESTASQTRFIKTTAIGSTYLTAENVTLGGTDCGSSTLTFTCDPTNEAATSVTIVFHLAQQGTPSEAFEQSSVSFQTSVTMRNVQ